MSATARKVESLAADPAAEMEAVELAYLDELADATQATEYATRGARKHRLSRPHLRMVSPLRSERASRGMFALIVTGLLIVGMVVILVINTTIAQGAFTVSELQAQQATLTQQEQELSRSIADAAAPDALEQKARAMGMVPSESPVFLNPDGSIVGKPKAARGSTSQPPALRTPADATAAEAVDSSSTDLPSRLPANYDPAAADAAQRQAQAANQPPSVQSTVTEAQRAASMPVVMGALTAGSAPTAAVTTTPATGAPAKAKVSSQWSDTVIAVSGLSSGDAGLSAVPAR
jgi:hypothetical protein